MELSTAQHCSVLIINWQWIGNPWSPICSPALPYAMQKEEQAFNYRDCCQNDTRLQPILIRVYGRWNGANLKFMRQI